MAKLHFKYGTMNSGKSIDLIRTAYNYEEMGYKVLIMKPEIDKKGNDKLNSRVGFERKVDVLIKRNESITQIYSKYINSDISCIFIDEVQFLSRNQINDLFNISKIFDIPVICYGLRNNFKINGFEGSIRLLEIADELEEIKTLCECKEIARYVGRKIDNNFVLDGDEVIIDGEVKNVNYIPMCGKCYLKKVKKLKI